MGKKVRDWQRHIDLFRKSGLTQKAYAEENGFSTSALRSWLGRSGKRPKHGDRFVEAVVAPSFSQGGSIKVALVDGTVIETNEGGLAAVAELIVILRGRHP